MIVIIVTIGILSAAFLVFILERFLNREKRYNRDLRKKRAEGNYLDAIIAAKRLIQLNPIGQGYYLSLAELQLKINNTIGALKVYKQMIERKIFSRALREVDIIERIASIHLKQKNYREAFIEYLKVYSQDKKNVHALIALGQFYGGQGNVDKALSFFIQAVSIENRNSESHYYYAIALLDKGNIDDAIKELETSLKISPENAKSKYFLACCYNQKQMSDKAKSLFAHLKVDQNKIPRNIVKIGILTQNIPKLNLEEMEDQFSETVKKVNHIRSIEELYKLDAKEFMEESIRIIARLGYVMIKEIRDKLNNPEQDIVFLIKSRSEKDNPEAKQGIIQISRIKSEVGVIPFEDFTHKVNSENAQFGIYITTSEFNDKCYKQAESLKNIKMINGVKLNQYL